MKQELGEASASYCAACSRQLRWERNVGEEIECWLGRCECGWLRIIRITHVVEADS